MAGLFGGGAKPKPPTVVRMPTQGDPSVLAAQARAREAALKRGGRQSTFLSDAIRSMTGSTGRMGR